MEKKSENNNSKEESPPQLKLSDKIWVALAIAFIVVLLILIVLFGAVIF